MSIRMVAGVVVGIENATGITFLDTTDKRPEMPPAMMPVFIAAVACTFAGIMPGATVAAACPVAAAGLSTAAETSAAAALCATSCLGEMQDFRLSGIGDTDRRHRQSGPAGRPFGGQQPAGRQPDRQGREKARGYSRQFAEVRVCLHHAKLSLEEFRPHDRDIGSCGQPADQLRSTRLRSSSRYCIQQTRDPRELLCVSHGQDATLHRPARSQWRLENRSANAPHFICEFQ